MRTGLTTVGLPGAEKGLQPEDPTLAELMKPEGYLTAQHGKNHLGDRNEFLPTLHGFDEFYGNLYHLNAEEEPEQPDYPKHLPTCSNCSCRVEYWIARRLMSTTQPRTRVSAGSECRPSSTPAH